MSFNTLERDYLIEQGVLWRTWIRSCLNRSRSRDWASPPTSGRASRRQRDQTLVTQFFRNLTETVTRVIHDS